VKVIQSLSGKVEYNIYIYIFCFVFIWDRREQNSSLSVNS
jgi:hypothetical protein